MSVQAYQDQQHFEILGASPLELVRALYRGAIQSVRNARTALAEGRIRERSAAISKACAIVQELTLSLDRETGGEIASNLAELYIYIHHRLGAANIEQNDAPLAEVEKLLTTLCEAWEQIPDPATEEKAMRLSA
jgi:flagellar secretion chaperone FliS